MPREQTTGFLEATVAFLLLTNALGILAATWAIYLADRADVAPTATHSRLKRFFAAWSPGDANQRCVAAIESEPAGCVVRRGRAAAVSC